MAFKYVILAALVAVANAGLLATPAIGYAAAPIGYAAAAPAALTSQHSNILRSFGNLGQVSTYSKTIDTPYSSVRKYDTRVSNDALAYPAAYHAAPAFAARAFAAPALAAPLAARAIATPAAGLLGVAYSAAPTVAHMTYTNGLGIAYTY